MTNEMLSIEDNLDILGALNGRRAYKGPNIVQIDLTNNCNLNCVGCWCHSELLGELKLRGEEKRRELEYRVVKKLINDLSDLGVKEIMLSGSGEPFMYSKIMEVVRLIKKKKMKLTIITNFTLLTKKTIKELVDLRVDNLTVSLWAGDAETYVKTHPNQTKKTFEKIKENLKFLNSIKGENRLPLVKIYNVISRVNYKNIREMLKFALETNADSIEFQVIDTIPKKTDSLALTKQDVKFVQKQMKSLLKQKCAFYYRALNKRLDYFKEEEFNTEIEEFPKRFAKLPKGFGLKTWLDRSDPERRRIIYSLSCPAKKRTWPPIKQGYPKVDEKINLMKFMFNLEYCKRCKFRSKCPVDDNGEINIYYLEILGFGSFNRRISSSANSETLNYDTGIIDLLPCYVGWIYSRILANGDVIPCCKSHKMPMGNLYKKDFRKIWFSRKYNKFRYMAKNKKKSHPYFKKINCYKGCDNLGMNLEFQKRIEAIPKELKREWKLVSLFKKHL